MCWLIEHPEQLSIRGKRVSLDPELVRQAIAFASSSAPQAAVVADIADAWRCRRLAAAAYARLLTEPATHLQPGAVLRSLLHMHHIRAHGIDPDRESITYRLARAVALSWQAIPAPRGTR